MIHNDYQEVTFDGRYRLRIEDNPIQKPFLISIALGTLLNPLNFSVISIAIPRLQAAFHLDFTVVSWIISSYYLASAIARPVMGKVADQIGRKRVFLIGCCW